MFIGFSMEASHQNKTIYKLHKYCINLSFVAYLRPRFYDLARFILQLRPHLSDEYLCRPIYAHFVRYKTITSNFGLIQCTFSFLLILFCKLSCFSSTFSRTRK